MEIEMRNNIEKIARRDRGYRDDYESRGRKDKNKSFRNFRRERSNEKTDFVRSGLRVIPDFENYQMNEEF
jgi:hypothetical protein